MKADRINKSSGKYQTAHVEGVVGSYFGMSVGAPSVSANACTLVNNQVNSPAYTGAAALAATMPSAKAGSKCVFSFSADPAGGVNALTIDCAGSDVWETGCVVPTTSSNLVTYDVSAADETSLVFTPTNDTVNFLSQGATIEFVCERDGYWYVHVTNLNSDIGVTAGACTGTLLFAS